MHDLGIPRGRSLRWMAVACAALLGATAAASWSVAGGSLLPLAATVAVVGAVVLVERPVLGLQLAVFMFYINLLPILTGYHRVMPSVALALPLIVVVPLVLSVMLNSARPVGSQLIRLDLTAILLAAFLGVLIVSTALARNLDAAFIWTADFAISGLALYLIIVNVVRTEKLLTSIIWAALAAGAFLAFLTIVQEVTKSYSSNFGGFSPMMGSFLDGPSQTWRSRPGGPVGDPNRFAQILLVLVPLGLFRMRSERGLWRVVAGTISLLLMAGVALSYSRGAGVALILILPLVALIWNVRPRNIALAGVAALAVVLVVAPGFFDRVETVRELASISSSDQQDNADHSMRSRLTKNLAAFHIFLDHPLIGVGPDNFGDYAAEYADPVGTSVDIVGGKAHNLYLGLLSETGLLGFSIFAAAIGSTVVGLWNIRRRYGPSGSETADFANAMMLALLAYALTALFLHLSYQRYFWFIVALAGALIAIVRESDRATERETQEYPWSPARHADADDDVRSTDQPAQCQTRTYALPTRQVNQ